GGREGGRGERAGGFPGWMRGGIAGPPAWVPAGIDGEVPARSGLRRPGSNRPVRIDRNTALTSTPAARVGASMPWREGPPRGRGDRPPEPARSPGGGRARARGPRRAAGVASGPPPAVDSLADKRADPRRAPP